MMAFPLKHFWRSIVVELLHEIGRQLHNGVCPISIWGSWLLARPSDELQHENLGSWLGNLLPLPASSRMRFSSFGKLLSACIYLELPFLLQINSNAVAAIFAA